VDHPEGRITVPSHWVYKILCNGPGNVRRFKAILVCAGNHEIEGIDYLPTYALTARLYHVRLALANAAKSNSTICQMDVCMACLAVDLEEDISMHPPQGYSISKI